VTLTTAVISAATGRPVDRRWAMTGEVTLRGPVLPVGGIKEKVLAADRLGLKGVVVLRPRQEAAAAVA
jgi:ATP-dependent Lon protease